MLRKLFRDVRTKQEPINPDYYCTECGADEETGGEPSICSDCLFQSEILIELIEAIHEARKEWHEEILQFREELKNAREENGLHHLERFAKESGQEEEFERLLDSMIVEADEEQDDEDGDGDE